MKALFKSIKETKVIEGSRIYYVFLILSSRLIKRVGKVSLSIQNKSKKIVLFAFRKKVVIQNEVGTFLVGADDSISKSSPYFEKNLHSWLDYDKRKDTFIDIGANIGFYSIFVLNKHKYKRAVSFEANPDTFEVLRKNIELNNLNNKIILSQVGLSDKEEVLNFKKEKYHTGISKFHEGADVNNDSEIIKVPVESFDSFVERHQIKMEDISFVKIDVEGYEKKVLEGMKKALKNLKKDTVIFIEIWERSLKDNSIEILGNYGFSVIKKSGSNFLLVKK